MRGEAPKTAGGGGGRDIQQKRFVRAGGGADLSTEECTELQGVTPTRAHLSLQEVYGDFSHHNDRRHLTGGVPDNTVWKILWKKLAVKSVSCYSAPPGKVGHLFTVVLDVD